MAKLKCAEKTVRQLAPAQHQ